MALSKSGKAGSNVTQLDVARKTRSTKNTKASKATPGSTSTTASKLRSKPAPEKTRTPIKKTALKTASKTDLKSVPEVAPNKASDTSSTDTAEKSTGTKAAPPRRVSNRSFDTEKVERIKAAIAKGGYRINYLQVADKFIEHERYA